MQPSHNTQPGEQFKQAQGLIALVLWLITSCSVFTIVFTRKFGTIGTRTYTFPFLICMLIMSVLGVGTPLESQLFNVAIWVMVVLYLWHMGRTQFRRRTVHVHSYSIGQPRLLKGDMGFLLMVVLGSLAGIGFIALEAPTFGAFLICSSICQAIDLGMLEARDNIRVFQVRDAQQEQERLLELYERNKNSRT